jgi:non-canonical (house-cleaning) NTP pyrophosphatase
MGPALGELLGDIDVRQKYGMIGYLTGHFTNRTQEYTSIAQLAIGLWYGSKKL